MKKINIEELYGKKYNYLILIKEVKSNDRRRYVEAKCKCGVIKVFEWDNLRSGKSQSCGCKKKEKMIGREHTLYRIWRDMKQRCYNSKCPAYKYYGEKGVFIDDRWLYYEVFYNDNVNKYKKGLELDRFPDRKGFYSVENTRWVTHKENMRNTNRCRLDIDKANEIRNSDKNTKELSIIYGVNMETIRNVKRNESWTI